MLKPTTLILICFSFLTFQSPAQEISEDVVDIDPTNFFSIKEKKDEKEKLLYDHGRRKEFDFVDHESIISVEIDHNQLKNNIEFVGNISISAFLNDRKIRVSGYSEVGEESIAIGVDGVSSPRDFVSSFIGLLVELSELQHIDGARLLFNSRDYALEKEDDGYLTKRIEKVQSLKSYVQSLEKDTIDFESILLKVDQSIYYSIDVELSQQSSLQQIPRSLAIFLLDELESYYKDQVDENLSRKAQKFNELKPHLLRLKARLPLLTNYIAYLSLSSDETSRAFSKSIEKDPIFVSFLSKRLFDATKIFEAKFDAINAQVNNDDSKSVSDDDIDDLLLSVKEVGSVIIQLQEIRDSFILNSLKQISQEKDIEIALPEVDSIMFDNLKDLESEFEAKLFISFIQNETLRNELIEKLTSKVGILIYKKLIPGLIDLSYEGAKEGDELRIYVDWYNHEGDQSYDNIEDYYSTRSNSNENKPIQYLLTKFKVKKTGFSITVSDSFFLVDRSSTPADTTDVSPSKFKGAPGVSMMWSYGDDGSNPFWNFLEPSLGVNASYLDFDTSKDIEIGIGLTVGIFRNKMYFTYGTNLNTDSGRYFGIGLSFANLGNSVGKKDE